MEIFIHDGGVPEGGSKAKKDDDEEEEKKRKLTDNVCACGKG